MRKDITFSTKGLNLFNDRANDKVNDKEVVGVVFSDGAHADKEYIGTRGLKVYHYFTGGEELSVGDFAIVCVSGSFKVVEIVELGVTQEESRAHSYLVQRVDKERHQNFSRIIEEEKNRKRRLKILIGLQDELNHYLKLAENDENSPELQALLEEEIESIRLKISKA